MELPSRTLVIVIILIVLFALALLAGMMIRSHFIVQVNNASDLIGGLSP